MLRITISQIVAPKISVFDADSPHLNDGSGKAFVGCLSVTEATGLVSWFDPTNPVDPWTICEALVAAGFATKKTYGPGFYGHVDYFVTDAYRAELAQQEAEAEYYGQLAAAEIAAETAIPQHLVW